MQTSNLLCQVSGIDVIKAKFYFLTKTDGTAGETVTFGINMTPVSHDDDAAYSANVFAYGEGTVIGEDGDLHISAATTYISASGGASASLNDLVCFRVARNTGLDNYGSDAHLLGVAIQYKEQPTPETAW